MPKYLSENKIPKKDWWLFLQEGMGFCPPWAMYIHNLSSFNGTLSSKSNLAIKRISSFVEEDRKAGVWENRGCTEGRERVVGRKQNFEGGGNRDKFTCINAKNATLCYILHKNSIKRRKPQQKGARA